MVCLSCFTCIALVSFCAVQFENTVVVTRSGRLPDQSSYNTVYRVDLSALQATPIYTSVRPVTSVERATMSDLVIVCEFDRELEYCIEVIDLKGELQLKIEDGVSAVFLDVFGKRIAYTKGYIDNNREVATLGTWIRDLETGEDRKICESGRQLEWASFNNSLYISNSGEGGDGFRYLVETGEIEDSDLLYGSFSPAGRYRWGYMTWGGVYLKNWETDEIVSTEFELLKTRLHGTPLYWMSDTLAMLPHNMKELEEYLLYVETGKTLKTPGRVLSVTGDEKYVYVCKPGLVIEKVAMDDLEVLYEGKGDSGPVDAEAPLEVE